MSGRKLNSTEQRLHQAALVDPKKTLSQKECDTLVPDPAARLQAINFLLGTGLFKVLKDVNGNMSYRVVMKQEMDVKKDMSGEESMVLSHIQASANEGIWTKHLKAKTELHQTVIDRCLKSLTQKQLIKTVKSVRNPTRKIFMLFHLEPSVEMTGGPWYTDNELDTEFIKLLCSACLRFIRDRSLPKQNASDDSSSRGQPLYPISAAPAYPTAQQILIFLSKSRITETQLSVEHVEMLLNVLVLDGEIEQVPAFGAALWEANVGDERQDESDEHRDSRKKDRSRRDSRKRRLSRKSRESGSETDEDEDRERKSKKKRKKSGDSDEQDGSRTSKKKRKMTESDDGDDSDGEKNRKRKGKRRKHDASDESETAPSDSDSDSDSAKQRRRKSKSRQRSSSPAGDLGAGISTAMAMEDNYGACVYRAIKQEKTGFGLSQAPCVRCPTFEFCKDKGPVNPEECIYYEEWLGATAVARE